MFEDALHGHGPEHVRPTSKYFPGAQASQLPSMLANPFAQLAAVTCSTFASPSTTTVMVQTRNGTRKRPLLLRRVEPEFRIQEMRLLLFNSDLCAFFKPPSSFQDLFWSVVGGLVARQSALVLNLQCCK